MSNKTYKCIKSYPGVNEGAIAKEDALRPAGWFRVVYNGSFLFNQREYYFNPEFWEEVVEKQWKIICKIHRAYFTYVDDEILSIERLTDNITFTIGNEIKVEGSHASKIEEITKIQLNKEGVPCLFTKSFHNNGVNIMKAIKCEKLFTTEDGVAVFNGDNYWYVVESDLAFLKAWTPRLHTCDWCYSDEYKIPPLGHVQFSTEKAAKDWLEKNRPVKFTTEDGVGINSNKKLYGVVLCNLHPYKAFDLAEHEYNYNASINLKDFKWFVDENKAIEYIDMNRPKFSKKDLLDASINIQYGGWFIEGLIKKLGK